MNETIKINGIKYQIEKRITAESARNEGLDAVANIIESNRLDAHLYLRRPNGKKLYFATELTRYNHMFYTEPISL